MKFSERDDDKSDDARDETFPGRASPRQTLQEWRSSSGLAVSDNPARTRFEVSVGDHIAFLAYERTHDILTLIHTEVPEGLRGRHVGEALVEAALHVARSERLRIVAVCPFVRAYLRKHPSAT